MTARRKKVRRPYVPAIEGATEKDKGVVVSAGRARWKVRHAVTTEDMARMTRFVWMRQPFSWSDRHKLHAGVLGACMRAGLLRLSQPDAKAEAVLVAVDYRRLS